MANTLIRPEEVFASQEVQQVVRAMRAFMASDLRAHPLQPWEIRYYPNPFGRDLLPIGIQACPIDASET